MGYIQPYTLKNALFLCAGILFAISTATGCAAQKTNSPSNGHAGGHTSGVFHPKVFSLDNGLQVVVIERPQIPVVSHMVWYRVGAADEPVGVSGIAHFLEHLMFKGSRNFPDGMFSRTVQRLGGEENAFTSHDYTAYFQNIARDSLATVMEMEADRMQGLQFDEEDLQTERQVVLEERRMRLENKPHARLMQQTRATLYSNHPYGRPVIGWLDEIHAWTYADVRTFYERHYRPDNAILLVAGDVTAEEVLALAKRYYGPIRAEGILPERIRPQEPKPEAVRLVTLEDPRVEQPAVNRLWLDELRSNAYEDELALEVLADILGGSELSVLHKALVTHQGVGRGVALSASAHARTSHLGPDTFILHATPAPGVSMETLEDAMMETIQDFLQQGVSQQDIDRVVARSLAEAVYARDSLSRGIFSIGDALASAYTIDDVEKWPQRLQRVSIDDVMDAARRIFSNPFYVRSHLLPAPPAAPPIDANKEPT